MYRPHHLFCRLLLFFRLARTSADHWQVLLQTGGEHACKLISILEATFEFFPEYSSSGGEFKNNSRGTCTVRLDWLRKPHRMLFSTQPSHKKLDFSSFRWMDFAFYSISSLPTEAEVILTPFNFDIMFGDSRSRTGALGNDGSAAAAMQQNCSILPRLSLHHYQPCACTVCFCHRRCR
jgi:hypothetical protein